MLSVPLVGRLRSEILEKNGYNLEKLKNAQVEDIAKLDGFSEKIAKKLIKYANMVDREYSVPEELIFEEFRCSECNAIVSEVEPVCHNCGHEFFPGPENYENILDSLAEVVASLYRESNNPELWREGEKLLLSLGKNEKAADFKFRASSIELEQLESEKGGMREESEILTAVTSSVSTKSSEGRVNGLVNGSGPPKQRKEHRNSFLNGIVIAAIIIIPVVMAGIISFGTGPAVVIDGNFSEWAAVPSMHGYSSFFTDCKIQNYNENTFLYVHAGTTLGNGKSFKFAVLVDDDSNSNTGYPVNFMGVDRVVWIYSHGTRIRQQVLKYTNAGWVHAGNVRFAMHGGELEMKMFRLNLKSRMLLYYDDGQERFSSVYTMKPHGWALLEGGSVLTKNMEIERVTLWNSHSGTVNISKLMLKNVGNATSVRVRITLGDLSDEVTVGENTTVFHLPHAVKIGKPVEMELFYLGGAKKYQTVKISVKMDGEFTAIDRSNGSYVSGVPQRKSIDGIFLDWQDAKSSQMGRVPLNVDIWKQGYDKSENLKIYMSVYGTLFGTGAPELKISGGNGTGGNGTTNMSMPQDTIEVFVDSDSNPSTGYRIGGIGAEYRVLLSGYGGEVRSTECFKWDHGWKKANVHVNYAKNDNSVELGLSISGNVYYRLVNWEGVWDSFGAYLLPTRAKGLNSQGMSSAGDPVAERVHPEYMGKHTWDQLRFTFGGDVQVTSSSNNEQRPTITKTADGTLWVSFHNSSGYLSFANSTDNGATWNVYYLGSEINPTNPVIYSTSHTPDNVVINEVYFDPPTGYDDPQCEWIELYNPTQRDVDISGWFLADGPNSTATEGTWTFPSGTVMSAGGYLLIVNDATYKGEFNALFPGVKPDFDTNASNSIPDVSKSGSFGLANGGDDVHLFKPGWVEVDAMWYGNGGDMGSVNAVSAVEGHSAARYFNAWDTYVPKNNFYDEAHPTPGAKNRPNRGDVYIFFENHTAGSVFTYYILNSTGWYRVHLDYFNWWSLEYNLSVVMYNRGGHEAIYVFMENRTSPGNHDVSYIKYVAPYWYNYGHGPIPFIAGSEWEGHPRITNIFGVKARIFVALDWYNSTGGMWEVDIFNSTVINVTGGNDGYWYGWVYKDSIYGHSYTYPDVFGTGEVAYMVMEYEYSSGNHDLVLLNTTNYGASWKLSKWIATTADDEVYPRVIADGSIAYVFFLNATTHVVMEEEYGDYGTSFLASHRVSDANNGIAMYGTVGVFYSDNTAYVVWTGSGSGNDIYYDNGIPEFNMGIILVPLAMMAISLIRRKRFK